MSLGVGLDVRARADHGQRRGGRPWCHPTAQVAPGVTNLGLERINLLQVDLFARLAQILGQGLDQYRLMVQNGFPQRRQVVPPL